MHMAAELLKAYLEAMGFPAKSLQITTQSRLSMPETWYIRHNVRQPWKAS